MKVPMMDMRSHQAPFLDTLKAAITAVVDSGRYILGPEVAALEAELAETLGVSHAIGVSSGTDALVVALTALELGPGDAVLTTPYSFFATAEAIVRVGARPVFADIDSETCNLDPDAVRTLLSSPAGRGIKALLPVHLFGQCADMEALLQIAEEAAIPVVEDAAQAIGAKVRLSDGLASAGAMGQAGCFSFYPSKNLGGIGDGGLVVTSDPTLAARMRALRQHGAEPRHVHPILGGNFRLDAIQAAALRVKLPYLEGWHRVRRDHARAYDEGLASIPQVQPLRALDPDLHTYNQYVIRVPEGRDALAAWLADQGVGTAVYYPIPIHLQGAMGALGHRPGDFPVAERAARQTLAIPIGPELTPPQRDHVLASITAFFGA